MSEISAAMGVTGLESLDQTVGVNRRNYTVYQQALRGICGVRLHEFDQFERTNYQYIVVEVDNDVLPVTRDQLVDLLWAENVRARRYFSPGCHGMEPYRTLYPRSARRLPRTQRAVTRTLILPTGTGVSEEQVIAICGLLRLMVEQGDAVASRLSSAQAEAVGV
jgi:dTDP-4-amino-4,6-dideoxygalactose transaminase